MEKETIALIDSHAHLELEPLVQDPEAVMERAAAAGLVAVITVGIDLGHAEQSLRIAEHCEGVFACVGFHPHNAGDVGDTGLSKMQLLAAHTKVVGYGEIGLDFFRNWSPRESQVRVFADQLSIAKSLAKPVIIHLRDAYREGLDMLEKAAPFPAGGVIHCFSGGLDDAERALNLGFHISIPGTVTYKKNEQLREIVGKLPEDRLLLETDCPFLSPEPLRGKDNEPANIVLTAKKVAEVRGASLELIAHKTTENAIRLFRLPLSALRGIAAYHFAFRGVI